MKKVIRYFFLIIAGLVLILILTNPPPKKFKENLEVIIKPDKLPNGGVGNYRYLYYGRQNNYFLFSIYSISFDYTYDQKECSKHYKVLGIFGNFYTWHADAG